MKARAFAFLRRVLRPRWVRVYLALLLLSHLTIQIFAPDFWVGYHLKPPAGAERIFVDVPRMTDAGPVADKIVRLSLLKWEPAEPAPSSASPKPAPVLLLHGSPAQGARDYRNLAPRLTETGRTVYALDRVGYGNSSKWVPSYSVLTNARYTLAAMEELGIERAHVVGWSYSGGVVIHLTDIAPQRLASVTMLGAIGIQEGEGSGSYYFEHFKYAVGYVAVVILPEFIPHFNLIGDSAIRHAFIRDFWDTDQRPLRAIMQRNTVPTLILHGRHDPLVPAWTAEQHAKLIPNSRLVMLDGSHFFPFGPPADSHETFELGLHVLEGFFARHDAPGIPVLVGVADFAPVADSGEGNIGKFHITRSTPWPLIIIFIALATLISEDLTVIAVGMLVARGSLDLGVGLTGCYVGILGGDLLLWCIGRFFGRRALKWGFVAKRLPPDSLAHWQDTLTNHAGKAVFLSRCLPGTRMPTYVAAGMLIRKPARFLMWVLIAVLIWTPFLLILSVLIGPRLLGFFETVLHGPWAIAASLLVLMVIVRIISAEATYAGRQKLRADIRRIFRIEFWPAWAFYIPIVPWIAWLALRHRGPMTFTCANPGVPHGGGVVGESKHQILSLINNADNLILHQERIGENPDVIERTRQVIALIRDEPRLAGYPVILKPDVSQRGHAVKLAHSDEDVHEYLEQMTRTVLVQRYHPGPHEAGILWSRVPIRGKKASDCPSEVFTVTRKVFPVIVGDGQRTLERLIWEHPRYRMQAHVFLTRFADQIDRVPAEGERVKLGVAGNHCQGTMFIDGSDLVSEELTRLLARLLENAGTPDNPASFDFGRLDIRYTSDEDLRAARGLAIVEVNGTMSESTNMYDPGKSVLWTYRVLARHWRRLYRLGHKRRLEGVRPTSLREIWRTLREQTRGRKGPSVSD